MGINEWHKCPVCIELAQKEIKEQYGKLSMEGFIEFKDNLLEKVQKESMIGLNYEFFFDSIDFTLNISVDATCRKCGTKWEVRHTQQLKEMRK